MLCYAILCYAMACPIISHPASECAAHGARVVGQIKCFPPPSWRSCRRCRIQRSADTGYACAGWLSRSSFYPSIHPSIHTYIGIVVLFLPLSLSLSLHPDVICLMNICTPVFSPVFTPLRHVRLQQFILLRSCICMDLTRSGSYFQAAKSPNIQPTPQEIRPEGS